MKTYTDEQIAKVREIIDELLDFADLECASDRHEVKEIVYGILDQTQESEDATRLDFLATRGMLIIWGREHEWCRIYHDISYDEDARNFQPYFGYEKTFETSREAIDAVIAAEKEKGNG